jgi:hypothetical protein
MTTVGYARFNIKLDEGTSADEILQLQEQLHDAAVWADAEDHEVFYSEENQIIGVGIPVEEDISSVLEAGAVLGFVKRMWEESEKESSASTWLSLVGLDGQVIYSPLGI